MQVADIQGDATAATLGAQKTTAMSMVQDASFLMMLSTNLYSNQMLACIRETMCNAWDAHIEAKRTDVPVKITITAENELIIEDSGLGIPEDMFEQIYGTFGGSTKRTNTAVTGGFGLGCKSPWAYTESFRVISENQGKKVIYNLVKASVEAEGLPAITRVMETVTERSGLTVRFQLREDDVRQMKHYIEAIACHGDMLVDFEHVGRKDAVTGEEMGTERLDTINLDPTPGSYDVEDHRWYHHYMGQHSVFVRYGAVIYPMLDTPGTKKALDLLREFMQIVGFRRMVVQAAPGTLALTPNREALSSSKMTEDGLTDLCVALVARIEDDIIKQIPASILQAVERLTKHDYLRCGLEHYASLSDAITPVPVRRYLSSQLGAAKYSKYVAMLKQAEHRGFKNSHTFTNKSATHEYHRLRRRLSDKGWQKKEELKFAFLKHFILRPLSRVFQKHPKLLKRSEFHHAHDFSYHSSQRKDSLLAHLDPADFSGMQQMIDHPTVFITTRTKYLDKSIKCCPDVTDSQDTWVYKIAPRDSNKDVIVKAFEESGMKVIDLTLNHEWDDAAAEIEEEKIRRNANRKPIASVGAAEKKSANLLMSLSNVYDDEGKRKASVGMIKLMEGDLETSNTPVFYVPVESVSSTGSLGRFGYYLDLTADERKHGVIVRSGVEKNMAIKRGAVHMDAYLAKQLWDRIRTPEFAAYRTKQRKEGLFDEHHISAHYVELMEYLGIKLTGFDKLTVNPVFDRAAALISNLSAVEFFNQVPGITQEELTHYKEVISHYKLEELPFITKIKALKQDDMLSRLFLGSGCLDLVKQFPERKAALKSLVMSVFKSGPTNE